MEAQSISKDTVEAEDKGTGNSLKPEKIEADPLYTGWRDRAELQDLKGPSEAKSLSMAEPGRVTTVLEALTSGLY